MTDNRIMARYNANPTPPAAQQVANLDAWHRSSVLLRITPNRAAVLRDSKRETMRPGPVVETL